MKAENSTRKRSHAAGRAWRQRLSSILLLPLTLFTIGLGIVVLGADYEKVTDFIGHPVVGLLLFGFIAIAAYHMSLGIKEIVEDYVHEPRLHRLAIAASVGYAILIVAASGVAIVRLNIGS